MQKMMYTYFASYAFRIGVVRWGQKKRLSEVQHSGRRFANSGVKKCGLELTLVKMAGS